MSIRTNQKTMAFQIKHKSQMENLAKDLEGEHQE